MSPNILLINIPNLNLLGTREPQVYGSTTVKDVEAFCASQAESASASLSSFQSNHEGAIIDRIHEAGNEAVDFIIINPGAYTHTGVAIRDALLRVNIPFIEYDALDRKGIKGLTKVRVHISNIHTREPAPFRHRSYFKDKRWESLQGLGFMGILLL